MTTADPTSIWQLDEFAPHAAAWTRRQQLFAYRRAYYDGTIYRSIRKRFIALGQLQATLGPRLYRGTKALFLMLSRAVDVDAGIIPGGWSFATDAPPAWAAGAARVLAWSDWATDGVLYVHYGAQYGVTGLKVADLRAAGKIVIKPLDPCSFMLIRGAHYDPAPAAGIIAEQRVGRTGPYEYAEVIEPARIRTFVNGRLTGIDGREAEYENVVGAVPLIERHHMLTGDLIGECTYHKAIPLLDEVNELASYLADIVRKHADAQWMVAGAEAGDLTRSSDNVWFVPAGGDVKAIVASIDIPGVLEFIKAIRAEVAGSLPELAFDELRGKDQIATATLELQLMELVLKIKRCRPNYDHGLADALRLAGRAAESMGLGEIAALNDEALQLDPDRPVLPLDRLTQLQIAQAEAALEAQRALAGGDPIALASTLKIRTGAESDTGVGA